MKPAVDAVIERIGNAIAYGFAVVVVITAYEVVMRYVFASPTTWVHELSIALCAVAFAFGGPYAAERDAHLRISIVSGRAKPWLARVCSWLTVLSGAIFLSGLAYAFAVRAIETGWKFEAGRWVPETTGRTWDVPLPPFMNGVIALCCLAFLVVLLARALRRDQRDGDGP